MPLITKNFRLNSLANLYAAAVYARIQQNNGGDFFNVQAGQQTIQVNIIGGAPGVRALVDAYYLEAIQLSYQNWEQLAILLLTKSLDGSELTKSGWEFWESMVNDMGSTVEGQTK
ncbi:hypothetical protein [Serratia proteamaculans]|uniref:hypothetical protein n=1 Tax=Serratia proteamaculans TaxID=28151 RepID=UPI0010204BF6|nr:hypothetical protein [Serratia proteamaculans]RYM50078.1 hypothetical protein BSQ96_18810 [Serratia proteamaculans]